MKINKIELWNWLLEEQIKLEQYENCQKILNHLSNLNHEEFYDLEEDKQYLYNCQNFNIIEPEDINYN